MLTPEQLTLLEKINALALDNRLKVFLVGGVVRDMLLGHALQDRDLDLVVEGNAIEFAKVCQKSLGGTLKIFERFFTAKLEGPRDFPAIAELDFASTRSEHYPSPGALPVVRLAATLAEDLKRRDFTVNSIAVGINELCALAQSAGVKPETLRAVVIDPFKGAEDLQGALVRVLHADSFSEDPTRIFRACRYAARMQGRVEATTLGLLKGAIDSNMLGSVSRFRHLTELRKIIDEERPLEALSALFSYGVFRHLKLYAVAQEQEFFAALQSLCAMNIVRRGELRWQVFLRVVSGFLDENNRRSLILDLGLGKKGVAAVSQDLVAVEGVRLDRRGAGLSDTALLLACLKNDHSEIFPTLRAEASKRGLVL